MMMHVDARLGGSRCAAAGAAPPMPEIAPRPSAAAPPARKFRRAGLDGQRDGSQHWQVAKNLRRVGLAFIPSSRFVVMCAGSIQWATHRDLSFCFTPVPGWSRVDAVDANVAPIGRGSWRCD
jgi:hypothetical protein